jgi:hypothetical protein
MNPPHSPEAEEPFHVRRERLAVQISKQRGELAAAYQQLEKPIRYTEYGMRGFGFIRNNPWVVTAVPAVFSLASTLFGLKKKKSAPVGRKGQAAEAAATGPMTKMGRVSQMTMTGVEQALRAYNLYRRVRSFLP